MKSIVACLMFAVTTTTAMGQGLPRARPADVGLSADSLESIAPALRAHVESGSVPGLIAMVGKGERGPAAIEAIRRYKAASLIAVGGAAYLVAKAIRKSKVLAFEDLGMEAIYEFEVRDMPVTVAVDSTGTSVHQTGPAEWQARIGKIPVAVG